jgi:hypothetical protein
MLVGSDGFLHHFYLPDAFFGNFRSFNLHASFYSKDIKDTDLCGRLFAQVLQHLVTHGILLTSSTAPADICSGDGLVLALIVSPELSRNFVTSWRRNQLLQELIERKSIALFIS